MENGGINTSLKFLPKYKLKIANVFQWPKSAR